MKRAYIRLWRLARLPDEIDKMRALVGAIAARLPSASNGQALEESELRVFSQFGEDGILQFILSRFSKAVPRCFVEFGVEDYREATTRLLLETQGWRGLVIDSNPRNIESIRQRPDFWTFPLEAVCAFVDRDNINKLISSAGLAGRIGILSIDIDGNDYWVWEAIQCVNPEIVVVEYNGIWGPTATVSIPYDEKFTRFSAHYSGMYWGCSLAALEHLGRLKGYRLIGVNSAGVNAFFVRADSTCDLPSRSAAVSFREPAFRQARGRDGQLSLSTLADAARQVADLPLVDVTTGKVLTGNELDDTWMRRQGHDYDHESSAR